MKRDRAGRYCGVVDDVADVIDAGVAGGVDLDHVDVVAARDRHARIAFAAGLGRGLVGILAVERLGEDAGHGRLADAARAAEEIRVGDAPGLDRLLQRLRNVILPDDFIERCGAISAGEDGVGHWGYYRQRPMTKPE